MRWVEGSGAVADLTVNQRRWSSANGDVASAWSTSVMRGSKTEAAGDSGEDAVGSDITVRVVYEDGSKSFFASVLFSISSILPTSKNLC